MCTIQKYHLAMTLSGNVDRCSCDIFKSTEMLWSFAKGKQCHLNLQCARVVEKCQRELKQEGVHCALEQRYSNGLLAPPLAPACASWCSCRLLALAPCAHLVQELIEVANANRRCTSRQLTPEVIAKCYQQNIQYIMILAVHMTTS